MKYLWIPLVCLLCIAQARFATEEETSITIESEKQTHIVNADGSYEIESELLIELKKEDARSQYAKMELQYIDKMQSIEVLDAKTIFDGNEYPVDKKAIEDKPLASVGNGFEDNRQVSIPFPKVEVGAKIYIKTKIKSTIVITKNHFYTTLSPVSSYGWTKAYQLKLSSKIPLNIQLNDPHSLLDIKTDAKNKNDKVTCIEATLKKPATQFLVNERLVGRLSPKKTTWISLSSLDDYKIILKDLIPLYDDILKQPLPALHQEILEEAKKEKTEEDQITKAQSLISEKVQYLGSWMTFKGFYVPRSLEEVEKTRVGDCKDFSATLVVVLRKMGFKADVVFVERTEIPHEPYGITTWMFNHAIVKAVGKDNKVYWLDPTNFTSATTPRKDIHDRPVLVPIDYEKAEAALENIPKTEPFLFESEEIVKLTKDDRIENTLSVNISKTHHFAEFLTGAHLKMAPKSLEDMLFSYMVKYPIDEKDRIKTDIPELKSRILQPISFKLQYVSHDLLNSNIGKAFILNDNNRLMGTISDIQQSDELDWFCCPLGSYVLKKVIVGKKIQNPEKLNNSIETPWFIISRSAEICGLDTVITLKINVLEDIIKNEDLKSEAFTRAQEKINRVFTKFIIELD